MKALLLAALAGAVYLFSPPPAAAADVAMTVRADTPGAVIDPAVYGGHREIDLGMMRLFGGFSERVFQAYDEAFPLSPGATERLALCQLYPLLVHANLFGGSYVGSVERLVARYT